MLVVGFWILKTPLRADMLTGIVRFWQRAADATLDKAATAARMIVLDMIMDQYVSTGGGVEKLTVLLKAITAYLCESASKYFAS